MVDESKLYMLSERHGQWIALSYKDSAHIEIAGSLEDLVAKCDKRGLKLYSVDDETIDEIYDRITRVEEVFDWLHEKFPGHLAADEDVDDRPPIGFRRP